MIRFLALQCASRNCSLQSVPLRLPREYHATRRQMADVLPTQFPDPYTAAILPTLDPPHPPQTLMENIRPALCSRVGKKSICQDWRLYIPFAGVRYDS